MPSELIAAIGLALLFDFLNGMRDAGAIVATMISSRAFRPPAALAITAVAEFTGPFLFGVVVAKTVGSDVVEPAGVTLRTLIACLVGANVWNALTWFLGIPGSSSHALIGGLLGAALMAGGVQVIQVTGLYKVLFALFSTPLIGFLGGFLITRLIYFLAQNATPRINDVFRRSQLLTGLVLGLSHGANDSQKTMGLITLSLLVAGALPSFQVPFLVVVVSAATIALGAAFGGLRLIRALGGGLYKIRPLHGFSTQLTSAIVVLSASLFGLPVSTSQILSSAVVGVGASERVSQVRWSLASDILTAWLITIPASALLAAGAYGFLERV